MPLRTSDGKPFGRVPLTSSSTPPLTSSPTPLLLLRATFPFFMEISGRDEPIRNQASISQPRYLSECEVEALAEGLAAEVPEAFVGWIDPDQRLQQEPDRLHHLGDHQVHRHRHVDLLIWNKHKGPVKRPRPLVDNNVTSCEEATPPGGCQSM
ncbi:hypothetical protein EYF80_055850 [Liparis tanakae]|uniref:Uncharacterized protein n=1 Tax=Liparis tanakae TaxID=230148 RepID=A0A4Z2F014_9TELE|nr:hypothetical protein EYF80_055850 [Liparis tanakae]